MCPVRGSPGCRVFLCRLLGRDTQTLRLDSLRLTTLRSLGRFLLLAGRALLGGNASGFGALDRKGCVTLTLSGCIPLGLGFALHLCLEPLSGLPGFLRITCRPGFRVPCGSLRSGPGDLYLALALGLDLGEAAAFSFGGAELGEFGGFFLTPLCRIPPPTKSRY